MSLHKSLLALFRFFVNMIVLLIIKVITLIKWFFVFLVGLSSGIFFTLAAMAFLTAIISYIMGLTARADAMWMVGSGFIIFMIPVAGGWIVAGLSGITDLLRDYMDS